MREQTTEYNATTITYSVSNVVDLMRAAVAAAKRAADEATDADFYKKQVDLEAVLAQKLREVERIDEEIQALNAEREDRISEARTDFEKHKLAYQNSLRGYATIDDVTSAREEYEAARSATEEAERVENSLFEQYCRARDEAAAKRAESETLASKWQNAKTGYQSRDASNNAGGAAENQRLRSEYTKRQVRFDAEKASIDADYAPKILELRQSQSAAAAAAKAAVDKALPVAFPQPPALPAAAGTGANASAGAGAAAGAAAKPN